MTLMIYIFKGFNFVLLLKSFASFTQVFTNLQPPYITQMELHESNFHYNTFPTKEVVKQFGIYRLF